MSRLTEGEFKATMGASPQAISDGEGPPFDFWPYLDSISEQDYGGHDFNSGVVERAWDMPGGRWQHVLFRSDDRNVFMVLVLDKDAGSVYGHHLLDLNEAYGV